MRGLRSREAPAAHGSADTKSAWMRWSRGVRVRSRCGPSGVLTAVVLAAEVPAEVWRVGPAVRRAAGVLGHSSSFVFLLAP